MRHNNKISAIPSAAGLLLEVCKSERKIFYDNQTYDTTLLICQLLFGGINVMYNESKIVVRDGINITLHLSGNETKIYFDTHILPAGQDPTYNFIKENYSFRLFTLDTIFNYLLIKRQENEFIKTNEG